MDKRKIISISIVRQFFKNIDWKIKNAIKPLLAIRDASEFHKKIIKKKSLPTY